MKPGRRRSIRLPGYDFASAGWYFVTICWKDHAHLFGEIRDGEMVLNKVGKIAEECWM
jgi:putative transposase